MNNSKVFLTPEQIKLKLKETITLNDELEKKGLPKVALNFVGTHGMAKTSSIMQFAKEEGIGIEKVNMANIDDLGEVTGYPIKEYLLSKDDKRIWANEKNYDMYVCNNWVDEGSTRTGYAEPQWVSNLRQYKQSILLLDDSLRAQQRFINALMDLIYLGQYYGWKLPSGCNIVMTNNPSDSDYQVATEDDAHSTRYFTFHVKFDIDSWVKNSQSEGTKNELINFMIKSHNQLFELIDEKNPSLGAKSSPRQWSMLFNTLILEKDLQSKESQRKILENGSGILPSEMVNTLIDYINSPDYYMVEPSFIFDLSINNKDVLDEIEKSIGGKFTDTVNFKPASANVLITRIKNYLINLEEPNNELSKEMADRLSILFESDLLGGDFASRLVLELYKNKFNKKMKNLINNDTIHKIIVQTS